MAPDTFEASPLAGRVAPEQTETRDRDLGFGTVVGRDSRERLLNRDGSFNVIRRGLGAHGGWAPYHLALTMSWTRFFAFVTLAYIGCNVVFAALFALIGSNAIT